MDAGSSDLVSGMGSLIHPSDHVRGSSSAPPRYVAGGQVSGLGVFEFGNGTFFSSGLPLIAMVKPERQTTFNAQTIDTNWNTALN